MVFLSVQFVQTFLYICILAYLHIVFLQAYTVPTSLHIEFGQDPSSLERLTLTNLKWANIKPTNGNQTNVVWDIVTSIIVTWSNDYWVPINLNALDMWLPGPM